MYCAKPNIDAASCSVVLVFLLESYILDNIYGSLSHKILRMAITFIGILNVSGTSDASRFDVILTQTNQNTKTPTYTCPMHWYHQHQPEKIYLPPFPMHCDVTVAV